MKFTIFLCIAFIVSVACVTEPDEQKELPELQLYCTGSIYRAIGKFYKDYSFLFHNSTLGLNFEFHMLKMKMVNQMSEVYRAIGRATSMELPIPLVVTTNNVTIECSEELAEKVVNIIENAEAAANALNSETQTTPRPTDEEIDPVRCARSIRKVIMAFGNNFRGYDAPDNDKKNEYLKLTNQTLEQIYTVIVEAQNANSTELLMSLNMQCSEELLNKVLEIASIRNATLNGIRGRKPNNNLQPLNHVQ